MQLATIEDVRAVTRYLSGRTEELAKQREELRWWAAHIELALSETPGLAAAMNESSDDQPNLLQVLNRYRLALEDVLPLAIVVRRRLAVFANAAAKADAKG